MAKCGFGNTVVKDEEILGKFRSGGTILSGMDKFRHENDILWKHFLLNTWFKGMKAPLPRRIKKKAEEKGFTEEERMYCNFTSCELELISFCTLDCKYCYLHRYGHHLLPNYSVSKIKENTEILLDWMRRNDFAPEYEIFSGDIFHNAKYADMMLGLIYDAYKDADEEHRPPGITIPINPSFLIWEDAFQTMLDWKKKFSEKKMYLGLSFSFDGKYMDKENRPFKEVFRKVGKDYTDELYHRAFELASKYGAGFHPMVYSNNIEKWIDNFLWFQENFHRYGIPPTNLYLLEVRNQEWNVRQAMHLGKFIYFLMRWSFRFLAGGNRSLFADILHRDRLFNTLSSAISTTGRGIGCSVQSTFSVRVGDLSFFICHRTNYPIFLTGRFVVENGKIRNIVGENIEIFLAMMYANTEEFPYCETCLISSLCSGGCLGAQFEFAHDMFTPIPTVCMAEHFRFLGFVAGAIDTGTEFLLFTENTGKRIGFSYLLEVLERYPEIWEFFREGIDEKLEEFEKKIGNKG